MKDLFTNQGEFVNPDDIIDPLLPKIKATLKSATTQNTLYFNGRAAILLDEHPKLNFQGAITMMAWIYIDEDYLREMSNFRSVLQSEDNTLENFLQIYEARFRCGSWNNFDKVFAFSDVPLQAGDLKQWIHICSTHDGTYLIVYKNGIEIEKKQTKAANMTKKWVIGAGKLGIERFFIGYIKNVGIWSSALSRDKIVQFMNGEIVFSEPSLVGFWNLNEGAGEIANDRSENKIKGLIKRAEWRQF